MGRQISMAKVRRIHKMHAQGVSQADIARELNISHPTVHRWVHRVEPIPEADLTSADQSDNENELPLPRPGDGADLIKWILTTPKFNDAAKVSLVKALLD